MGSDLLELASRVEALEGPSREVDAEIAASVRYFPKGVGFVWQAGLTPNRPEPSRVECCTSLDTGGPHYAAPTYTASLDVALTLVPETMALVDLTLSWEPPEPGVWPAVSVRWYPPHKSGPDWHALTVTAATPALALCAAALRAIASKEQTT